MGRPEEALSAAVLLFVGVMYAVVPARVERLLAPGTELFVGGVLWASATLPKPVFVSLVFVSALAVALAITLSAGRSIYTLLKHVGPRAKRLYGRVAPSSPLGKFVFVFSIVVAGLLSAIWAIPALIESL